VLLFSVVLHEYAHGYAALKQGDMTAYQLGRLTLNPIKHIDPFMTVIFPLMLYLAHAPILGAAKPVPVNPRNFRQHRRGDIIVSLAGVGANLLIALLCVPLLVLTYLLGSNVPALASSASLVQTMLKIAIEMNLGLLFFNLVPIPPLDGSHVMKYLLPPGWSLRYQQIGRYGFLILLVLLNTPALGWWLRPVGWLTSALLLPVSNFMLPTPGVM